VSETKSKEPAVEAMRQEPVVDALTGAEDALVDAVEPGNGVSDGGDHAAGSSCCEPSKPGYENAGSKDALSKRLKRIEGQVRGVEKMVADDRYCIDVLTQIAAIQSGLKAVALGLLDDHMAHCVVEAARAGGDEQATKLAEVSDALRRFVR